MKFIKIILLIYISFIFNVIFGLEVKASSSFSGLETKITYESNIEKIKKLQLVFSEFGLYNGNIDGNYNSIKDSLIKYQKSVGITKDFGYFGIKTLKALKKGFPNTFDNVVQKYLKMEIPHNNIRYFYVTAYYSPLKGQKRYTTGSYYGDIRLNGTGKKTASGKKVFEGILAGPRNYKFGTKIEFEGLGVGVVEDRGGAIVNKGERGHEYDRIDIWMGYGVEGLERALKWGKRKVKGKIVENNKLVNIKFGKSTVSKYKDLKIDAKNPKKEEVIRLQQLFRGLKLYNGNIDGKYDNIKKILIDFQVKNKVIASYNSKYAGYFGPKTYLALRQKFGGSIFEKKDNILNEEIILPEHIVKKLDKIHLKIVSLIEKKYGKDTLSSRIYRNKLRNIIKSKVNTTKDKLKQKQLEYIVSLI